MRQIRSLIPLLLLAAVPAAFGQVATPAPKPVDAVQLEAPDDPPIYVWRTGESPMQISEHNGFTSYQVNVGPNGQNITGDAANEPSIAMDPTDPKRMSIGWRQFNSVQSNFRQGGWAYTTNGGTSWTFPGVLDSGFRSDPVLMPNATGEFFYLSLVTNFYDDIWRSVNGGQSWARVAFATGGDKQWFTIDTTNSPGRGFQYQSWSTAGNNYGGRQFTRSTDGGLNWMDPIFIPNQPSWGTLDVDTNGTLFISGVNMQTGQVWCVRSSDAKNAAVVPTFDQSTPVAMGGSVVASQSINPQGLVGQLNLAVDRSGTATNNNVYIVASVRPPGTGTGPVTQPPSGADVMFVKSTDGGKTFSPPRRINDDPIVAGRWHWFGTLSVAPNGRIDVVWLDTRNAANNTDSQLFYSYSTDGGETWSANAAVSAPFDPFLGYPNQSKMGDYMTIVSDNEGGNVAYCATLNGEQDIYYVRVAPPSPNATPTPSPSPTATPSPTPTATPTPTPLATATPTPTASPTPEPTATPSPSPSPSPTATPTPAPTAAAQPVNLSTRVRVESGDNVAIGGFIITGDVPKRILLRAIGPSLSGSGVTEFLADPVLRLHGPDGVVILTNDNWRDDPVQEAQIRSTGVPPENDLESAADVTLEPGFYTAVVGDRNNTAGIGLIEVYDLNQAVPAKLANISTRANAGSGDNIVIAGFLLGNSDGNGRIAVRGIGPSLSAAGVSNPLANPTLQIRTPNGDLVVSNDNWQDDSEQAAALTAEGLAPADEREAAILRALPAGAYTALLRGENGATGVGLVEIYDLGGQPAQR